MADTLARLQEQMSRMDSVETERSQNQNTPQIGLYSGKLGV